MPLGLLEVEALRISRQSAHEAGKVVSPTHRLSLTPQEIFLLLRIKLIKNSNDPIWNRTRGLPACSAVPQATAPPRALLIYQLRSREYIFIFQV